MIAHARAQPRSFVLPRHMFLFFLFSVFLFFVFFRLFLLDAAFIGLSFSSSLACAHIPVVSAPGILDQEVRHNLAIFSTERENKMKISSALSF